MFGRDTASIDAGCYDLSLVFVHPTSRACGCLSVDMTRLYKVNDDLDVVGFLLELLVHCPPVRDALMTALVTNRSLYLFKLMRFVKRCAGQSGFSKASGTFKNA